MLQQIADLVEFDRERFSEDQILEDFNHKFHNSVLKIDGQFLTASLANKKNGIVFLHAFNNKGEELAITKAKTIEKVRPPTGLYSSPKGLLYLHRIPKRQWIKSFSLNNNYRVIALKKGKEGSIPAVFDTILVDTPTYAKESMIYDNDVYLHWAKVGKVVNDTLYVTNKNFFEEIKELWNQQYQIILDADNQLQKAEKLILDF